MPKLVVLMLLACLLYLADAKNLFDSFNSEQNEIKKREKECDEEPRSRDASNGILIPATGCLAYSRYDDSYSCHMALDGDLTTDFATKKEGEGAWIQVTFKGTYAVTSMEIANRAAGSQPEREMNKELQLTFSNDNTTQVTLAGAEMTGQLQTFAFDEPIEAESVRITTLSVYSTYNNGYAEVAFFGKKVAQEN